MPASHAGRRVFESHRPLLIRNEIFHLNANVGQRAQQAVRERNGVRRWPFHAGSQLLQLLSCGIQWPAALGVMQSFRNVCDALHEVHLRRQWSLGLLKSVAQLIRQLRLCMLRFRPKMVRLSL